MSAPKGSNEWKVGIFMLAGILIISAMAIHFGKVGQGFRDGYKIIVEFPNASGLLKNADVYLSGAPVGKVEDAPALIEGRYSVRVPLRIKSAVKIPKGSIFIIGSSGFLGDSFVSISPPANPDLTNIFAPDEMVIGTRQANISDLTSQGGDVVEDLKKRMGELEITIKKINNEVLSETNTKNIEVMITNFKNTSENLQTSAKELGDLIKDGKETMSSVKTSAGRLDNVFQRAEGVMKKADGTMDEVKVAVGNFSKFGESATKTAESARTLVNRANTGDGVLGLLLGDRETAANLRAFISNLRTRGVLFYKNPKEAREPGERR